MKFKVLRPWPVAARMIEAGSVIEKVPESAESGKLERFPVIWKHSRHA